MPRRGWQQLDVPSGWVRVLKGPRPKSEQWPLANEKNEVSQHTNKWRREKSNPTAQPDWWKMSRVPEVVEAQAIEEVRKLKSAVSVFCEGKAHSKLLLKALGIAWSTSKITPKRIESCKGFVDLGSERVVWRKSLRG